MLSKISTETVDAFDEEKAKRLMDEKVALQQQLAAIQDGQLKREQTKTRLDDIYTILDGLKNRPMEYDEQIVRQLLECITVDSKEQITVIFVGGLKVVQPLIDALRSARLTVRAVKPIRPSLEDLFMEAVTDPNTGRALAPGAKEGI